MARLLPILLVCLLVATACRNAPAAEREMLRREVETVQPDQRDALRRRLRLSLLGEGTQRPDIDPHMRASSAQGLGNLAEAEDHDVLLEALGGSLADENPLVRMECAIALGKLQYSGKGDERRKTVIAALRDRLAYQRDETGRLFEREFTVRVAMVNSLVQIGTRSSASALHDVASRLANDLESETASINADAGDKGLLDRSLEGLRLLTGQTVASVQENRRKSDEITPHLAWWANRISEMPEG